MAYAALEPEIKLRSPRSFERSSRKLKKSFGLTTMPLDPCTCIGSNANHGRVFAECMDEDLGYVSVACIRGPVLKQSRSVAPATGMRQYRHTKFGTSVDIPFVTAQTGPPLFFKIRPGPIAGSIHNSTKLAAEHTVYAAHRVAQAAKKRSGQSSKNK